ncbi:putative cell wall-binding protein [Clostridium algifaecis]|uniref:Cell wall-binding protein n=1 Tax=Clostridium algifaecis TaxID=1472040 RepID=A0ABS4KQ95_9CLOT|nr:cell wall-binding repeat-containing protein [Clostridium algifaecis]MBP2032223.1 putative cell wall-binding protein [Clostridium algifaecis]
MIRRKKIFSKIILGIFLASSLNFVQSQKVFADDTSTRLGGSDRYETSIKVSQNGWTTSDYVILASGTGYADALCAAPVAKKHDAPILLTDGETLSQDVKDEIVRLKARYVIEMGGTASISNSVEDELKSMNLEVERLGGQDRYETSVAAAKEVGIPHKIIITSGLGYADALSIAPIAANSSMPILLTSSDAELPQSVKSYIDDNKAYISESYVIGGTGVIPDSAIKDLPTLLRISGSDRYKTNVNVMSYFKSSMAFNDLYIVRGDGPNGNEFADALSVSSLAAKNFSPVVLTCDSLNPKTENFIRTNIKNTTKVVAVGGQASVSDDLLNYIKNVVSESSDSALKTEVEELTSISQQFKIMASSTKSEDERQLMLKIASSIDDVLNSKSVDSNFDSDFNEAEDMYNKLTDSDKNDFSNKISTEPGLFDKISDLSDKFGLSSIGS